MKILKKWCKIWGFRAKNPVFLSKILEKFGKKFGKGSEILEKVRKFRKLVFPNVRKFRKFGNSELSENYEKMMFNSNSKIAKNSFRLENQLESSVKSSECRALPWMLHLTFQCKAHRHSHTFIHKIKCV